MKFDDDILAMEYECFTCGLGKKESLDVGFCVEYELFYFDPIIFEIFLERAMSTFIESETFAPMTTNVDQTFKHTERKGLVDLGPIILPRLFIHDDKISRPMTHLLVKSECIS